MKLGPFTLSGLLLVAAPAVAQESQFAADFRREKEEIGEACGEFTPKGVGGCAYTLSTATPLHVAFGNLAPQNGFAPGLAFVEHYTPNEGWRLSWNADVVAAPSGAWRAGVYMKFVHTPATSLVVVRPPGSTEAESAAVAPRALPVIDVFVQTVSLKTLNYFGSGQATLESGHTVYGENQTLTGASVTYPLTMRALRPLQAALLAGATGRFITIRPGSSETVPSIDHVYDESTTPGLSEQPAFIEFREGIRFMPSVAGGWLSLNYLLSAQQFTTTRETQSAFRRWALDLQHEIPLYRAVRSSGPRAFNGPNECAQAVGSSGCPPVQWSRNREGSIGLRLLVNVSTTSGANQVPFYLQPTLGGSDINNESLLSSYQDYRFRAPNLLALQERVEHVLRGPVGAFFLAEQGKVTSTASELDFSHLATSMTVGLTLRAGGFPMVNLSFSWGAEGHHVIGSMNSTLLGGSPRPSLW